MTILGKVYFKSLNDFYRMEAYLLQSLIKSNLIIDTYNNKLF